MRSPHDWRGSRTDRRRGGHSGCAISSIPALHQRHLSAAARTFGRPARARAAGSDRSLQQRDQLIFGDTGKVGVPAGRQRAGLLAVAVTHRRGGGGGVCRFQVESSGDLRLNRVQSITRTAIDIGTPTLDSSFGSLDPSNGLHLCDDRLDYLLAPLAGLWLTWDGVFRTGPTELIAFW